MTPELLTPLTKWDRQIEQIRSKISEFRAYNTYKLPKTLSRVLSDDLQDEIFDIFDGLQIETLEWVLREIFQVTP